MGSRCVHYTATDVWYFYALHYYQTTKPHTNYPTQEAVRKPQHGQKELAEARAKNYAKRVGFFLIVFF